MQTLQQGTQLQSSLYNYVIEKVLGQGAFGITYLAKVELMGGLGSLNTNTYVTIKEFFMKEINGREGTVVTSTSNSRGGLFYDYKEKFAREAKNLSKLKHPNIVNVVEYFEANNTCYYVMEYLSGGDLDKYIEKRGGLTEAEAIRFTNQIGGALSFMHQSKMLHLDLKPKNIMLNDKEDAILIDFGLSKQYDRSGEPESSTKVGMGTPGYAPIEQANYQDGHGFPMTMDVYSLGATMYKMLTGKRAPEASVLLNEGFPEEVLSNKNVSEKMISVIEKAMSPTKKSRYQTVDELLKSLPAFEEETFEDTADEETHVVDKPAWQEEEERRQSEFARKTKTSAKEKKDAASHDEQTILEDNLKDTGKKETEDTVDKTVLESVKGGTSKKEGTSDGTWKDCLYLLDFAGHLFFPVFWLWTFISPYKYPSDTVFFAWLIGAGAAIALSFKKGKENSDVTPRECLVPFLILILEVVWVGSSLRKSYETTYPDYDYVEPVDAVIADTLTNEDNYLADSIALFESKEITEGSLKGHDWVDLGLPSGTKWATMNVGASSPSDNGDYFAWGETSPKWTYTWENLRYRTSGDDTDNVKFSKYVAHSRYGTVDGKRELSLSDDAACVNWGVGWRTPSASQIDELKSNCTYKWTTMEGKRGYRVTSKMNGNSIFLPAAGCYDDASCNGGDLGGGYLSRTLGANDDWFAYGITFYGSSSFGRGACVRQYGYSVRAVTK